MKNALAYIALLTLSLLGPAATAQVQDILTTRYQNGQLQVQTKDKVWRDATPLQPILTLITDASSGTASLNQRLTSLITSYGTFTSVTNNTLAQKANLAGGNALTGNQSVSGTMGISGSLTVGGSETVTGGVSVGGNLSLAGGMVATGSGSRIDINGSLGQPYENVAYSIGNNRDIGFTKKLGSNGMLTYGSNNGLTIAQSSAADIGPGNTFTSRLLVDNTGILKVLTAGIELAGGVKSSTDNSSITLLNDNMGLIKKSGDAAAALAVASSQPLRFVRLSASSISGNVGTATATELMRIDGATDNVGIGTAAPSDRLHVVGNMYATGNVKVNNELQFPQMVTANRKVVLYDAGNDNQFYGFGVNAAMLRYQVDATSSNHVWFAGSGTTASNELMRLTGTGRLGVGHSAPAYPFHLAASNPPGGVLAEFNNSYNATGRLGAKLQIHQSGISVWRIGQPAETDAFVIEGWNGGTFPERLRIDLNGSVGINTSGPTARLHVNHTTGYNQLRLEKSYTPTSSSDANGNVGDIAWDTSYIYVKTSAGWKRSALTTF